MPSSQERRAANSLKLRETIVGAARDLLVEHGHAGFTMRRLAERIGYSATTIYLYFQDKDDLLNAVGLETFRLLREEIDAVRQDTVEPLLRLRRVLHAYVDFGLRHPHHYISTFVLPQGKRRSDTAGRTGSTDELGLPGLARLTYDVARCVASEEFRPLDAHIAARALLAAVHGMTSGLVVHTQFPWGNRTAVVDTLIEAMLAGLHA